MLIVTRRVLTVVVCAIALVGCSLPRGAGLQSEVLDKREDAAADFAVYPVTRALLPSIAQWPQVGSRHLGWITASHGSTGQLVQPGDTVRLTLWDSDPNSLIVPNETRQTVLEDVRVSPAGSVFVPYVGTIRIAGRSPERAREVIQNALADIAPSAQVQLSFMAGRGNSVDLVGGVRSAGSFPMPDRNYSVLSLIAAGGGVNTGLANPQIRLQRGSRIFGTSVKRLFEEPNLDTLLQAGDQVIVQEDDRYFLSVGAAGEEALHPFTKDVVSAMDAVSIIGGVQDTRGDPQGILILREYPASALSAGVRGPRKQRVVFGLDLTTADGLFSARNFTVMPKDLIYVTESPVTKAQTIFGLVGSVFGLVGRLPN